MVVQVRTPEDLEQCDGLIIPGGGALHLLKMLGLRHSKHHLESTTIALLARLSGLLDPLREFLTKKPVWGTCAGAILLSQSVEGAKKGRTRIAGRHVNYNCAKWMGLTGVSGLYCGSLDIAFYFSLIWFAGCRLNPSRLHLK